MLAAFPRAAWAAGGNAAVLEDLKRLKKQQRLFGDEDPGSALSTRLEVSMRRCPVLQERAIATFCIAGQALQWKCSVLHSSFCYAGAKARAPWWTLYHTPRRHQPTMHALMFPHPHTHRNTQTYILIRKQAHERTDSPADIETLLTALSGHPGAAAAVPAAGAHRPVRQRADAAA